MNQTFFLLNIINKIDLIRIVVKLKVNMENTKKKQKKTHIKKPKSHLPLKTLKKYTLENNAPLLLKKKTKNIIIKPLTYIRNDTGKSRHFTPAAQE
jgi:hypothetical protein